jgi:hypothetical protein
MPIDIYSDDYEYSKKHSKEKKYTYSFTEQELHAVLGELSRSHSFGHASHGGVVVDSFLLAMEKDSGRTYFR